MDIEQRYCRAPIAKMFNKTPGCVWIPNRNIRYPIGRGKGKPETDSFYDSGSPDGTVYATLNPQFRPFVLCVECKAKLAVVPFDCFATNQESWHQKISNVSNVLYYMGLAVYPDRKVARYELGKWHLYLFPIQVWYQLREETWKKFHSKSIPLYSTRGNQWGSFCLDTVLSPWILSRIKKDQEYCYVLPPEHPLWKDYAAVGGTV